jgi:hypothetical protein
MVVGANHHCIFGLCIFGLLLVVKAQNRENLDNN